jgi:nitrogen regulatory protein PII
VDEVARMKMVVVIVKSFKLDSVKEALINANISGLTVKEVTGFGRQKGHIETSRGASSEVRFIPKVKIELAVPDERVDEVVSIVETIAHTGELGDGKIFVNPLEEVVRIRTGERGEDAL